jgi:hypothetical protein
LLKTQLPLKIVFAALKNILKSVLTKFCAGKPGRTDFALSFLTALYPDTNRKRYGAGLTAK